MPHTDLDPNCPVAGTTVPNKSVRPPGNQSFDSHLSVVQTAVLIAVTFNVQPDCTLAYQIIDIGKIADVYGVQVIQSASGGERLYA
jgi:hypothetical protein